MSNSPLSNAKTGSAQSPATSTYSSIGALDDTQDTASISSAPGQLSGDLPIRQDRVDTLRAQVESGTYTVDPRSGRHRHVPEPLPELSMKRAAPVVTENVSAGVPVAAGDLDALLSSISEAIEALVAWNLPAFQSAVERQRSLCDQLARHAEWRRGPNAPVAAQKVRELNRVHDRLLRHSLQWTRTLQSIFEAAGSPPPSRASVHFRG